MSAAVKISVIPLDFGWAVDAESAFEPMVFRSGGRAEAHARALAIALSRAGAHAYVIINDSTGRTVGANFYGGTMDPDDGCVLSSHARAA